MANSVSELRQELLTLTHGKVDIMVDDQTFKSTYQIMKELSEVWNDLADIDTANILELIGGKGTQQQLPPCSQISRMLKRPYRLLRARLDQH